MKRPILISFLSGLLLIICSLLFLIFYISGTSASETATQSHQDGAQNNITYNEEPDKTKNVSYQLISNSTSIKKLHRIPGEISEKMCKVYGESVYEVQNSPILLPGRSNVKVSHCVVHEPLIKGGKEAKEREFPHMALIGDFNAENYSIEWFCGGSLISTRFILTSAHCNITAGKSYAMVGTNVAELNDNLILGISDVYIHPSYGGNKNDIALLKLGMEVNLTKSIRPACLDTGSVLDPKAISTGWGVDGGGRVDEHLRKVVLDINDDKICSNIYPDEPFKFFPEDQICAGAEGKDSCQGDSGGPLQVSHKKVYCMYTLIGVTTFGTNCSINWSTNVPAVYTKVSRYIRWIEDIVWP